MAVGFECQSSGFLCFNNTGVFFRAYFCELVVNGVTGDGCVFGIGLRNDEKKGDCKNCSDHFDPLVCVLSLLGASVRPIGIFVCYYPRYWNYFVFYKSPYETVRRGTKKGT